MNRDSNPPLRLVLAAAAASSCLLPLAAHGGETVYRIDRDPLLLTNSGLRLATLTSSRTTVRDVGDRLFRLRAGIDPAERTLESVMSMDPGPKGGMAKSPVMSTTTVPCCWEVFGSLFYYTEDIDAQIGAWRPQAGAAAFPIYTVGDSSLDMYGGTIGIERRIDESWSAGFAVAGSTADLDVEFAGSSDVDTLSLVPYISYRREDALGAADFWADLMYAYGMHDISSTRLFPSNTGDTEGNTHQLELTTGINFDSPGLVHGPFAGLRWIDGDLDAYSEIPSGILIPSQDIESLASIVGYQVSVPIETGGGVVVPQFRAAWEHEFEDEPGSLFGRPVGALDEDVAVLGAGIGWYGSCNWNLVLDYEARVGENTEGHYVGMKIGKEF